MAPFANPYENLQGWKQTLGGDIGSSYTVIMSMSIGCLSYIYENA